MLTYCNKFSATEFINQSRPETKPTPLHWSCTTQASCSPAALQLLFLIKVDIDPRSVEELSQLCSALSVNGFFLIRHKNRNEDNIK